MKDNMYIPLCIRSIESKLKQLKGHSLFCYFMNIDLEREKIYYGLHPKQPKDVFGTPGNNRRFIKAYYELKKLLESVPSASKYIIKDEIQNLKQIVKGTIYQIHPNRDKRTFSLKERLHKIIYVDNQYNDSLHKLATD